MSLIGNNHRVQSLVDAWISGAFSAVAITSTINIPTQPSGPTQNIIILGTAFVAFGAVKMGLLASSESIKALEEAVEEANNNNAEPVKNKDATRSPA